MRRSLSGTSTSSLFFFVIALTGIYLSLFTAAANSIKVKIHNESDESGVDSDSVSRFIPIIFRDIN